MARRREKLLMYGGGLAVAALGAVGLGLARRKKKNGNGATVRRVDFAADGESELRVKPGTKVRVSWPADSPWRYDAQPTETVQVVATTPSSITFQQVGELAPGAVDQVFVLAMDGENLLSQHKLTFFGPEA